MRLLFFILVINLLIGCTHKDDSAEPNEYAARFVKELNQSDTFKYENSLYVYNERLKRIDSSGYFYKTRMDKWLNLQSLGKGYDSLQIRFSYEIYIMPEWTMIALIHDGKKWTAEISRISNHYNEKKEMVDTMSRKIRLDKPKSGWVNFISKLFDLKVLTIDDEKIISKEDRVTPADGDGLDFEIATKNVYRFYGYSNPEDQSEKYWQVINVNAIKKLLYQEFEVLRDFEEEIMKDWEKMIEENLKQMGEPHKSVKLNEITISNDNDTIIVKD